MMGLVGAVRDEWGLPGENSVCYNDSLLQQELFQVIGSFRCARDSLLHYRILRTGTGVEKRNIFMTGDCFSYQNVREQKTVAVEQQIPPTWVLNKIYCWSMEKSDVYQKILMILKLHSVVGSVKGNLIYFSYFLLLQKGRMFLSEEWYVKIVM